MRPSAAFLLGLVLITLAAPCRAQEEPAQIVHTNKGRFRIPFQFDAAEMTAMGAREVRLYVSVDSGATWHHAQSVQTSESRFEFESQGDGEYWFAVRTLDGQNQLYPQTPTTEPGLKVIVDTSEPQIQLGLRQVEPGKVEMSWIATDPNIDLSTLRLEYIQTGVEEWKPVNIVPEATGSTSWSVPQGGFVGVRGSVRDRASNEGHGEQQTRVDSPERPTTRPSVIDFREPIARGTATPIAQSTPQPIPQATTPQPIQQQSIEHRPFEQHASQPIVQPAQSMPQPIPQRAAVVDTSNGNPLGTNPLGTNPLAPDYPAEFSSQPTSVAIATDSSVSQWGHNLVSDVPAFRPSAVQDRYPGTSATPSGTRVVNTTKFQISYKIDEIGPSGVGAVEMYITDDDGRKWFKYGNDTDNASPFEVEVPRDGIYGFSIRVRSGQGVAADPPQPGEKATVIVAVDQTPPVAQLLAAQQGTGAALNKVLIRWTANDDYPAEQPIHLSYAMDSQGPWEPICDWQPNSGNYIWTVPPGLPAKLYIRLTARDSAGNVSRVETPQPVLIDMSKPSARIVDVEAVDIGGKF
jgi:hypothetical protein